MPDICKEMEKFGKGIGNVSRYRIVEALFRGPRTVNELVGVVKLSQSAVSQHLRTLRFSNIVSAERKGQEVYYELNIEYMLKLLKGLSDGMKKYRKSEK
jgi:ArsR family transcriptional regulator, arsenate/arsenite/antimonite-responsive transcriptional repressor